MKVGDLIKFTPEKDALVIGDMKDKRRVGTIVSLSTWQGDEGKPSEPILEVLWSTGAVDWILQKRVEVVNGSR